jgi:hypothetical protein
MVDAASKRVNKGGRESVWYRPPLPMARPVPAICSDGVSSRFSTTVENSVENSGLSESTGWKSLVLSESAYGEGRFDAILSTFSVE